MKDLWWVEVKGVQPKKQANSIQAIKRLYPMERVLRFFGWDGETRDYGEWVSTRCPFHNDSTASASVNLAANKFKCHACDVGGDIIDLVMEEEGITSVADALQWVVENID